MICPLCELAIADVARENGNATGQFGMWHLGGILDSLGGDGEEVPADFDFGVRHPGNQGFDDWLSAGNWFDRDPFAATF